MLSLNRKLLRETWQLKGQVFSIAMVVATGIMGVITMRGSYESLVSAQSAYYRDARFADIWVPLKRAPESLRERILEIPGVATADTRVTFMATLDLENLDTPAQGLFVSLPDSGRPRINDIRMRAGSYLTPGAVDEVIVSENFAAAHNFIPGDNLRAIINGRARTLTITGTAISPEHTYAVPPGSLYPDDERYGVMWMLRDTLGPAFEMDDAFNEALVTLTRDANQQAVIDDLNQLLDPYGGLGAYRRADQASHQILQSELDSNKVMGTVIPGIFLAVAAFLLHMVLGRMIATQRSEIAILKAFGYRDREVGVHYSGFALASVALGTLIGIVSGIWLGHQYVLLYGTYFDFPVLAYQLNPGLVVISAGVSLLAAAAGALIAVRRAVSLPPAEAMRPEPPSRFSAGWMERSGIIRWIPASSRMILRNMTRKPGLSFLSSLGIAFSVAILVIGMFMLDGVNFMMDMQFRVIQREDFTLTFNEKVDENVQQELKRLEGVIHVETWLSVPARLRLAHREKDIAIQGMDPDGRLRRIVSENGTIHPLPANGLVISKLLADQLHATTGDQLEVEILEGRRTTGTLHVAGIVKDFLGLSVYMNRQALNNFVTGPAMISGAYLDVAQTQNSLLFVQLKNLPLIAGVASPATMLASFETQMADTLFLAIGFLLGFACIIAVGVIYNGARISLSERARELASLRVMGFRRSEVSTLLLGEQIFITLLAIPLGWLLGYGLSFMVVSAFETEIYRIPFIIKPRTYLYSALITVIAAAASAELVRRRVNQLDLISVLKTRE